MQNNADSNIYPTMVKEERPGHEAFINENFPEGTFLSLGQGSFFYNLISC